MTDTTKDVGELPPVADSPETPVGMDRRTFLMRHAAIGAAAVMTGTAWSPEARAQQAATEAAAQRAAKEAAKDGAGLKMSGTLSPDLDVVKKSKGPVMTLVDEFYKVGPGPSSSHTIGPMRITYDFYQRCTKLPADQLAQATGLKVHLFGSLSATGKGHGTERASLAGLVGKEPATVDPLFLDEMIAKPEQTYPVKLGGKTFNLSLADVVYDAPKGDFPHPNTMTCKLMAGDKVLYEQEYYSVGGGFIEWKGYEPPKKGQPKYPYATMKELRQHAEKNNLSIADVIMANEIAVSGKSEEEINAFLDKIAGAMLATVKVRSRRQGRRPARTDQAALEGRDRLGAGAWTTSTRATAPSRWWRPARWPPRRKTPAATWSSPRPRAARPASCRRSCTLSPRASERCRRTKSARVCSPALAIGYLCKHNATLAAAEGGCQSEIGVASAMAAALIAQAMDSSPQVIENAAESALEHHLGMTCDPVAGYVQVPCIERCAFGAVKAWTAFMIATNEIASRHRVDLDTTIKTLADTGRDMNAKYKETSEAGLAAEPGPLLSDTQPASAGR